jgi:hypothetical protein
MADESQVVRGIDWKAAFPFTQIFRSFRIAIHPSKIILALLAMLLIWAGGAFLDWVWPARYSAVPSELTLYGYSHLDAQPKRSFRVARQQAWDEMHNRHLERVKSVKGNSLGDVKDDIIKRRDAKATEARTRYEKADKSDATRLEVAQTAMSNAIRDAYRDAEVEWDEAVLDAKGVGLFHTFYDYEVGLVNQTVFGVRQGDWFGPTGVVSSIRNFFVVAPVWAMIHHWFYFTVLFLYFLFVWSIFGGAISRIAAVHAARDEKISIRQALRFSTSKFLSFMSAPIIPLLIILAVGVVVALGGLLLNVPFFGPIVVGALFFLALAAGFVMTLVLIGTAGGLNLMYPTIAVEGSDSFDAISRSFSYLYARPWRLAFYTAVAVGYGAICYLFVRYFIYLMLTLTHFFAGLLVFYHADNAAGLWNVLWPSPSSLGRLSYSINHLTLSFGQDIGALLLSLWVYLVICILGAFAISFYFSANTIIYFLMRHEVDATELDDVYLEQSEEEFGETTPVTAAGGAPAVAAEAPPADATSSEVSATAEAPGDAQT